MPKKPPKSDHVDQIFKGKALAGPACVRCCIRNAFRRGLGYAAIADSVPDLAKPLLQIINAPVEVNPGPEPTPVDPNYAQARREAVAAFSATITTQPGVNTLEWLGKSLELTPESFRPIIRDLIREVPGGRTVVEFGPTLTPLAPEFVVGAGALFAVLTLAKVSIEVENELQQEQTGTFFSTETDDTFAPIVDLRQQRVFVRNNTTYPNDPARFTMPDVVSKTAQVVETARAVSNEALNDLEDCRSCVRAKLWRQNNPRVRLLGKFRARF